MIILVCCSDTPGLRCRSAWTRLVLGRIIWVGKVVMLLSPIFYLLHPPEIAFFQAFGPVPCKIASPLWAVILWRLSLWSRMTSLWLTSFPIAKEWQWWTLLSDIPGSYPNSPTYWDSLSINGGQVTWLLLATVSYLLNGNRTSVTEWSLQYLTAYKQAIVASHYFNELFSARWKEIQLTERKFCQFTSHLSIQWISLLIIRWYFTFLICTHHCCIAVVQSRL